jgi:hypothetical protein
MVSLDLQLPLVYPDPGWRRLRSLYTPTTELDIVLFWTLHRISAGFRAAWLLAAVGFYFHGDLVARPMLRTILAFHD